MILFASGSVGTIFLLLALAGILALVGHFVAERLDKSKRPVGYAECDADCREGFKHDPATMRCIPKDTDLTVVVTNPITEMTNAELEARIAFETIILGQLEDVGADVQTIADQKALLKTLTGRKNSGEDIVEDIVMENEPEVVEVVEVDLTDKFAPGDEVVLLDEPAPLTTGRWSPEDVAILEAQMEVGTSVEDMGKTLNRSKAAIKRKIKTITTA